MAKCSRCQGEGRVWEEEEGHPQGGVYDVCYHCGGEGTVDEETDFQDRLHAVAATLAYQKESDYRKACDSDPDGDGYDLCAAENGMRTFDYFRVRVGERTDEIARELAERPREDQELLVAWNEMPYEPPALIDELLKCEPEVQQACVDMVSVGSSDDIPF